MVYYKILLNYFSLSVYNVAIYYTTYCGSEILIANFRHLSSRFLIHGLSPDSPLSLFLFHIRSASPR